jgi:hypothetical protein
MTGPLRTGDMYGTVPVVGNGTLSEVHIPVPAFGALFIALKVGAGVVIDGPLFIQDASRTAHVRVALSLQVLQYRWEVRSRVVGLPRGSAIRLWRFGGGLLKTTGLAPAAYAVTVGRRTWQLETTARHASWAGGLFGKWTEHWSFEALPEAAGADQAA